MTVPVVGVISRKPPWRLLPEISATRFSVSGSLRPKLGLCILLVLVLLTLCLLVVPLINQYKSGARTDILTFDRPGDLLVQDFLANTWHQHPPNLVFSPAGLHHLLRLLDSLTGHREAGLRKYILPPPDKTTGSALLDNKSVHSLRMDSVLQSPAHLDLPNDLVQTALAAGTRLDVVEPTLGGSKVALSSTNHLSLVLEGAGLSQQNFLVGSKTAKRIPMLEIRAPMKVLELEDLRLVETRLEGGLTLSILLPARTSNLVRVMGRLKEHMASSRVGFPHKNVLLKIPQFSVEEVYPASALLESLGLGKDGKGDLSAATGLADRSAVTELAGFQLAHANITHSARLQLLQGKAIDRDSTEPEAPEAEIVCDRAFIVNVLHPLLPLPLLTAVVSAPDL